MGLNMTKKAHARYLNCFLNVKGSRSKYSITLLSYCLGYINYLKMLRYLPEGVMLVDLSFFVVDIQTGYEGAPRYPTCRW